LLPVAGSPRTHSPGHIAVSRARTGPRHQRPVSGALLTLPMDVVDGLLLAIGRSRSKPR